MAQHLKPNALYFHPGVMHRMSVLGRSVKYRTNAPRWRGGLNQRTLL